MIAHERYIVYRVIPTTFQLYELITVLYYCKGYSPNWSPLKNVSLKSKKISNDQELIQSDVIS